MPSGADDGAPLASPDWTVRDAVEAMQAADLDVLPVATADGTFVGIVTLNDVIRLDEILRRSSDAPTGHQLPGPPGS